MLHLMTHEIEKLLYLQPKIAGNVSEKQFGPIAHSVRATDS
jgi:hypothetical protein